MFENTMKNRTIKPILVILLLLGVLLACLSCRSGGGEGQDTAPPPEGQPPVTLPLIADGKTDYRIVYAAGVSEAVQQEIWQLQSALLQRTGVALEVKEDALLKKQGIAEQAAEILVGLTDRGASAEASQGLRYHDYTVEASGQKLVIAGGSDEALYTALKQLISSGLETAQEGSFMLTEQSYFSYRKDYRYDTLTLNGQDMTAFSLVYPYGDAALEQSAVALQNAVKELYGVLLPVVADIEADAAAPKLIVGQTQNAFGFEQDVEQDGTVAFQSAGNSVRIIGKNRIGTIRGVELFISTHLELAGESHAEHRIEISANVLHEVGVEQGYKVMSFNMLYQDIAPRVSLAADAILSEMPDCLGVQEFAETWRKALEPLLDDYYAFVGEPINESGWYNGIFYRKDRLELVKTETLWLSPTPEKLSKFEGGNGARAVTYAIFRDKETGVQFAHFNTHLDTVATVSKQQIPVLREIVSRVDLPFVVTGDFNMTPTWGHYDTITSFWGDSRYLAEQTTNDITCDSKILDYCFISEEIVPEVFRVVNDPWVEKTVYLQGETKGQPYYLSDHYPITLEFQIK